MSPMPGDDGGEVQLRASDADRERVAGLLSEALADGRLTVDEHRERIGVLYATRTLDELAPLTADLGTGRRDVEPQRSAAPVEPVARQVAIPPRPWPGQPAALRAGWPLSPSWVRHTST